MTEQLALPEAPISAPGLCADCRKPFRPRRSWQKFCSSKCRLSAWAVRRAVQGGRDAALTQASATAAGAGEAQGLRIGTPPRRARSAVLDSFHVRSHMTVPEALEGEAVARTLEAQVLDVFRAHPGRRFTPSEVHALVRGGHLLTSVRAAITNVTRRDPPLLVHHPTDRRPGPHGARSKESTWSLRA